MSSRRSSTSKESSSGTFPKISSAAAKSSISAAAAAAAVKPKKRSSLADLFDDGKSSTPPPPIANPLPVAQVFRAETTSAATIAVREVDKCDILLGAIIRTSERNEVEQGGGAAAGNNNGWKRLWRKSGDKDDADDDDEDAIRSQINHGITRSAVRVRSASDHYAKTAASFDTSIDNDYEYYEDEDEELGEELGVKAEEMKTVHRTSTTPTQTETDGFRKGFSSATAMVFHGRTRLPLTSSPAPLRKGKGAFGFDSTITSPNDVKRALFRAQSQKSPAKEAEVGGEDDTDKENGAQEKRSVLRKRNISSSQQASRVLSASAPASVVTTSSNLLGNFEESVLNGRLEPVSTVDGFTAEIGASGSFHPKHQVVPVTVFFYTLCDSNAVSSPYLGTVPLCFPYLIPN